MIVLEKLPMPPSSNHMYVNNRRTGGRFPSRELKTFKKLMQDYAMTHALDTDRKLVARWIAEEKRLRIERSFYFLPSRIITKQGLPKKIDVTNYIKAIDDAVSDLLGFDDKYFWEGQEAKYQSNHNSVTVRIFTI